MDRSKLVYILNRNSDGKLFPSSPLEAHKQHAIISAIIGVDQGYENPLFACLEVDYSDSDNDPTGQAYENVQKVSWRESTGA
jgi:splicing factor 3B subunit 3